jgi:hypothetical protein
MSLIENSECEEHLTAGTCGYAALLEQIRNGEVAMGSDVAKATCDIYDIDISVREDHRITLTSYWQEGTLPTAIVGCTACLASIAVRPEGFTTFSARLLDMDDL